VFRGGGETIKVSQIAGEKDPRLDAAAPLLNSWFTRERGGGSQENDWGVLYSNTPVGKRHFHNIQYARLARQGKNLAPTRGLGEVRDDRQRNITRPNRIAASSVGV